VSEHRTPEEDSVLKGAGDPSGEPQEGAQHEDLGGAADTGGEAGGGTGEGVTDPELKDAGPPAEGIADPEGSSGAEEGISPWADEAYSDDPKGPTQYTGE
jgi:hypothetical protein